MKKIITIGLVLVLGIGMLAGCGKSAGSDQNASKASSEGAKTAEKTNVTTSDDYFTWDGDIITGLTDNGKKQTALTIPDSAKKIGDKALQDDSVLTSIKFGNGLEEIGDSAFWGNNLTEVSFPSSLKKINDHAFENCALLKTITFSIGLEEIGEDAFGGCPGLVKIELPEGLAIIGAGAFASCPNIQDLYIPASIGNISYGTFHMQQGANVYVKKESWADIHFNHFAIDLGEDTPMYTKNYY